MLDIGGLYEKSRIAAAVLKDAIDERQPRVALVLGSALGGLADACEAPIEIPFSEVPHLREPTAEGHAGRFVSGRIGGLEVLAMSGRLHAYEGHDLDDVTFPVRIFAQLGVEIVVLTNAAGALDESFAVGDLMVIEDHINLTGRNPLVGPNDERLGPRFPDMSTAYDPELRALLAECAVEEGIAVRSGVYVGLLGPSYETPAEIRALRTLGGGAVGMSTVPEAIVARHAGLRVIGVSCITNVPSGHAGPLSHDEVMREASAAAGRFSRLLETFCRRLA
jgi:purine-nucleoside phosphorylase